VEQIYAMLGAKFLQNLEKEAKGTLWFADSCLVTILLLLYIGVA
jgi:hypothetical protein